MRTVTIYSKSTGEILRSFSGNQDLIDINVGDGEAYIDGVYTKDSKKVSNGVMAQFSEEETDARNTSEAWQRLKTNRDLKLQSSDWTQVPDAPVDQAAWAVYRQELRDLPANTEDPSEVVWPKPPTS